MHLETLTWLIEAERRQEAARLRLATAASARDRARSRGGLIRTTRRTVGRGLVDLGTRIAASRPPAETGSLPG
jgi:hypothetical protein